MGAVTNGKGREGKEMKEKGRKGIRLGWVQKEKEGKERR